MTSSVAYWMGTGAVASGSTCVITVGTPGGTASGAGDAIIVGGANSASSITISGVVDSAGNAYRQWNSSTTQNPTFGWIADSVNNPSGTAALPVGGTITVTFSGAGEKICGAVGCPGVSAAPIDQNPATTSNAGSTSPSITSGTLAQAVEMAVAIECNGNAGGTTMVWSGGFTSFFDTLAGSGGQAMSMAAKTTAATTAVTASGTITSAKWCMLLVTLKTSIPVITTSSLPGGTTGVSYSQTLGVSGGFGGFTWSVSAGSLPTGLSLAAGTGVISGTPHTAGTSSFTVTVTDGNANIGTQPLSITIASNLTVTTSALPGGGVGIAYSQTLAATGGFGSYTWSLSAGSLPTGLSLSSGGTISGTPALSGLYSFTAQVTDAGTNTATAALTITVAGFPQAPLDVAVELSLSGWTDITTYTLQREGASPPITITSGRQNETAQASPSSCAMQWNNRDGRFSPRNPTGPYYGSLGRNTPLRVSVPGTAASLRIEDDATSSATCPANSFPHGTAGLDLRIDADFRGQVSPGGTGGTTWAGSGSVVLAAQWAAASNQRSWFWVLQNDGTMQLIISQDGTTATGVGKASSLPVPYGRCCLRVALNATAASFTFYTAAAGNIDTGPWTQLGDVVTTAALTVFASTAPLQVGYCPDARADYIAAFLTSYLIAGWTGRIYDLEVRNGAGTLAAHPAFSAQTPGTTAWTDAQSNTWTLTGSATIDSRSYRAHAECSSLPQRWDTTGADVWTPVTASGLLRRLQQGNSPEMSTIRRGIISQPGSLAPVAYWPFEDGQGSASIAPGISGGQPMSFAGAPGFTGQAGSPSTDSTFACSAQLPTLANAVFSGSIPAYTGAGSIIVRFLLNLATPPADSTPLIRLQTTGTAAVVYLYYQSGSSGSLRMVGYSGSGSTVFDTTTVTFGINAIPAWVSMELRPSGGNVDYQLAVLTIAGGAGQLPGTPSYAGTVGVITRVGPDPTGGCGQVTFGHLSVQADWVDFRGLTLQLQAWNGEPAGNRFARLCAENGIQPRIYGAPAVSTAMGPQTIDTLANLLQFCEDSDRGLVFEPPDCLGLGYRTLASLYNQTAVTALSYTAATLGGDGGTGLEPVDDDQFTRNDVTVSRNGGSSAQVQILTGPMSIQPPPAGVGDYTTSVTVYTNADGAPLASIAGWIAWVGSTNQERYPTVPLNLARTELAGQVAAIQAVKLGDHIQITNPPAWLPPGAIDQLVYGATEKLGGFWWLLAWNTVPELPYEVAVAGTGASDSAHADTAGSQLHSSVSSGATSLSVDTTSGPLWTTHAGDFPFDIIIGGEQITVTNISGSSSPQTFTVTRSVNGVVKSQASGTAISLFHTPVAALS